MRLSHHDMHVYGSMPEEVLSFTSCNLCGMVLKSSSLDNHISNRHNVYSLSESPELFPQPEPVIEPKAKRRKIDYDHKIETKKITNSTRNLMLKAHNSAPILKQSVPECPLVPMNSMPSHHEPKADGRLKVKLKKTNHGQWAVVVWTCLANEKPFP